MTGTRLTATVVDRIFIGARSSDQILLSPDGGRLYVPIWDPCAIFVIDTSNGAGVARIELPTFATPHSGAFDYESGEEAAILHEDDEDNNRHYAHHPAFALSGSQLLVSTEHATAIQVYNPGVCVIDISTLTVIKTFPPPYGATEIFRPVVGHDGERAFLLSINWPTGDTSVSYIDIRHKAEQPYGLCESSIFPVLSPDNRRLYVNGCEDWQCDEHGVLVFDTSTCDLVATVERIDCQEMMVSVDGTLLYCVVRLEDDAGLGSNDVIKVIDTTNYRVQRVIGSPNSAMSGLVQSMDGNRLYCWMVKDGEHHLAIIDPRMGQVIHSARIDMEPSTPVLSDALGVVILCDLEQGSVSIHDAETLAQVASVQLEGDARLPVLAPTGDRMYVSHIRSEWIDVIELAVPPEPDFTPRDALEDRRQRRIPLELPT